MLTFKVVIIGDQNVGKTCLIKRHTQGLFSNHEDPSIGAQFFSKKMVASYDAANKDPKNSR
jgi:GTPase SAR1 family protein